MKADQIALDVFWEAPGRVRQRIVGRRDERRLPTDIRYHLDHLMVVTDDFGDRITMGEGDEVRAVLHPLAPGSERLYEFRLADSLTLRFPGGRQPVRVQEVRVRPRSRERPGVVGSVFLDRATAAVVRMSFTFTRASYVDPYLDHIHVALHNALWDGRFWLPHRQEIEIRRELPYLDFPAGTVIRGRYEIGDYVFNPELPDGFFTGPRISARPESELESFPFEEGLYAGIEEEGLAPTPDLREVRRRASQMVAREHLTGLRRLRAFLPSASSVARYDRAEGLYLGAGASFRPVPEVSLGVLGGYAFGRSEPALRLDVTRSGEGRGTGLRAAWNDLRSTGPLPAASGALNSVAAWAAEHDFLDPYFVSGVELFHGTEIPAGAELDVGLRLERHASARNVLVNDAEDAPGAAGTSSARRPVLPVDEGTLGALDVDASVGADAGLAASVGLSVGRLDGEEWIEARGRVGWARSWLAREVDLRAELTGGLLAGDPAPLQSLYRLGGRGTLPGYGYRAYTGDWYGLGRISTSWGVAAPWVRPRATASVGATARRQDRSLPPPWSPAEAATPRVSAGVGVGLFWDVLRVDLSRGLSGGRWEWNVSVNRTFWSLL